MKKAERGAWALFVLSSVFFDGFWRYGVALHLLHASPAAAIAFRDPRLGAVGDVSIYFHVTSTSSVRYPGRTLDSARGVTTPLVIITRPV